MDNNYSQHLEKDEINLTEYFFILWNRKFFILLFSLIVTFCTICYILSKDYVPLYKGTLLVRITEVKTEEGLKPIDNIYDIKYILESRKDINKLNVSIPHNSENLLQINYIDKNEDNIIKEIDIVYKSIIRILDKKVNFYKNFIPLKKIGETKINPAPINEPNKLFTVLLSFVLSIATSVLLVFFVHFIKTLKEEK